MQIPYSLKTWNHESEKGVIYFQTECKKVSGTAFKYEGYNESHYDICKVTKELNKKFYKMIPIKNEWGSFEITAKLNHVLDSLFVVEVYGFHFEIYPEEFEISNFENEEWFSFRVDLFSLYI